MDAEKAEKKIMAKSKDKSADLTGRTPLTPPSPQRGEGRVRGIRGIPLHLI